jgi:hypothetical protein
LSVAPLNMSSAVGSLAAALTPRRMCCRKLSVCPSTCHMRSGHVSAAPFHASLQSAQADTFASVAGRMGDVNCKGWWYAEDGGQRTLAFW